VEFVNITIDVTHELGEKKDWYDRDDSQQKGVIRDCKNKYSHSQGDNMKTKEVLEESDKF
jgi:hypothetical protein